MQRYLIALLILIVGAFFYFRTDSDSSVLSSKQNEPHRKTAVVRPETAKSVGVPEVGRAPSVAAVPEKIAMPPLNKKEPSPEFVGKFKMPPKSVQKYELPESLRSAKQYKMPARVPPK